MAEVDRDPREEQELLDPVERKVPIYLRVELYIPLILIAGISLAVLLYAQGMIGSGWQIGQKPGSIVGAFADLDTPVVLYVSPTAHAYLAKVQANHDVLVKPWREYLKEYKRPFKEITDPAELADHKDKVIIVPAAIALNDAERKALVEHHRQGGSILATGPIGARDGAGTWLGWGLMNQLFGARVADEVDPGAEKNFLVTSASPLTTAFSPGTRVWIGKAPEKALRYEGAGLPAARYMDWARTPDGKKPVVTYGEKDKARWVLIGIPENAWDAAPTPLRMLANGAVNWLQHQPGAAVATWPGGYKAAHLVTMNVDEPVENVQTLASTLDTLKIRGTFFAVADAAEKAPGVLKALTVGHEIAYHGDASQGFKDQAKGDQERRIKDMQQRMLKAVRPDDRIIGFRAPGESYDARTEEVLQAAGFRYHAVDPNRSDARQPLFAKVNRASVSDDLVVLPRTQGDDIIYLQKQDATLNDIISTMRGELALAQEEGALAMLSVHSRNYGKDSVMAQAVPSYLLALAESRGSVWLTTGSEVSDWWRKRENVRVTLNKVGQRFELEVSNIGDSTIEGATIDIFHPRASKAVIAPTKAWMPEATVRRVDEFRSQLIFAKLSTGHHGYSLVFE